MQVAIRQFFAIARLTALEALRQPLAFLLFATALFLITLLPLVLSHTLGESAKFVRDGTLAFMWLTGLLLGAHLACASLAGEIRRGTVSAVLSKPVSRALFFCAKFAGIATVMLVFAAGLLMAILMATRVVMDAYRIDWWALLPLVFSLMGAFLVGGLINFFLRRPFVSNTFVALILFLTAAFLWVGWVNNEGQMVEFGTRYDFRILYAGTLIFLAIAVLSAISVALATRLMTIPTLSICGTVFVVGLLSDYWFGRLADQALWARVVYYLLPNWQHFWVVDALAGDGVIPLAYVGSAALYAICYLAGVLLLGALAFQRMEVKA